MSTQRRHAIDAALAATTERLAHEIHAPSATVPDWSPLEWRIARATAAMQGISGLLAETLRWRGPDEWHAFLAEQLAQSRLRETRACELRDLLDAKLRARGVAVLGLKGLALGPLALYAPGQRPMGDLDLLVAPADFQAVGAIIHSLGYSPSFAVRRHAVFAPATPAAAVRFGEHVANPLRIELHLRVAEPLPARELDITDRLFPDAIRPGINPYRDAAALLLHLLLHAAGNIRAHGLRQIQIEDIARLAPRLAPRDWESLAGGAAACWWTYPVLALTRHYRPDAVPAAVLAEHRRHCPRRLRAAAERARLHRVSWSNPRIPILPGLPWARTPREAFTYARQRFLPDRATRGELERYTAEPALRGTRWYGISRTERILRWLFTRPHRVQTMFSVDAALRADS